MHVYPNYYKKFQDYIKKFSSLKYKKTFCFVKYKNEKFIIRCAKTNSTN